MKELNLHERRSERKKSSYLFVCSSQRSFSWTLLPARNPGKETPFQPQSRSASAGKLPASFLLHVLNEFVWKHGRWTTLEHFKAILQMFFQTAKVHILKGFSSKERKTQMFGLKPKSSVWMQSKQLQCWKRSSEIHIWSSSIAMEDISINVWLQESNHSIGISTHLKRLTAKTTLILSHIFMFSWMKFSWKKDPNMSRMRIRSEDLVWIFRRNFRNGQKEEGGVWENSFLLFCGLSFKKKKPSNVAGWSLLLCVVFRWIKIRLPRWSSFLYSGWQKNSNDTAVCRVPPRFFKFTLRLLKTLQMTN